MQLLSYQLQELEQLSLQEGELEQLERELKQLSHAESTLSVCHQINAICSDNEAGNILQQLSICLQRLNDLQMDHPAINNTLEMMSSAQIQVEEAVGEINHFIDHFDADPARMQDVDDRLSAIYDLARKHRVQPEALLVKQNTLSSELESIQCSDERVDALQEQLIELKSKFHQQCEKLSRKRQAAARQLEKKSASAWPCWACPTDSSSSP